ncbi:hypothetical protein [Allokutzneria albata]|uniref:Secreted protein n=1 Tax=Allokutzneria albata TaxID=211114 RepID=A0A1H0D447_ALLAB|nr:hypothetical protein [Allokutzneria albata]SDN64888.1 hypothetical protein SAMN04489726_7577 [Allokutzneria albata]
MSRTSRVAQLTVAALAALAALALPVVMTPTASADIGHCLKYLERIGIDTERSHDNACAHGELGFHSDYHFERCVDELLDSGVKAYDARRACERATW